LKRGKIKRDFPADLTIIDPKTSWVVDPNKFKSKSKNSPFGGKKVRGKVCYTIVDGKIVHSG
jgi:dihydroorotase